MQEDATPQRRAAERRLQEGVQRLAVATAGSGSGDAIAALRALVREVLDATGARGIRLREPDGEEDPVELAAAGDRETDTPRTWPLRVDAELVGNLQTFGPVDEPSLAAMLPGLAACVRMLDRWVVTKELLERLRTNESRYRHLVDASEDLVQSLDEQGRILFVNSRWQRALGCEGMPVEGRSVFDFLHGDDHAPCREMLRTAFSGRPLRGVHVAFRGPIGDRIEVEGDVWPSIENGAVVACHTFLRDTSRLRETEADRTRKTAFLDQVVEGAPEAILFLALDGTVQRVNGEFTRLFGFGPEEAVGRKIDDLVVPLALAQEGRELCDRAGQSEAVNVETVRRRKDGTLLAVSLLAKPIRIAGEQVATLCIYRDISARRQLEAHLALAQRMEAVGRLAGGIAHDFNNLLTIVQASTDLLAEHLGPDHAMRADVEEISRATQKAAVLTKHLLSFGRRQISQPVVMEIASAVDEVAAMLRRLIPTSVAFGVDHEPGPRRVKADPGQFEQVLVNLALNARDSMSHGGRLQVSTRTTEVDPTLATTLAIDPGPYAELTVEDSGCGIPPEDLQRIFEPFWTTKSGGDRGTGLGLATVYSIVRQCRGAVSVDSQVGKGSRFTVLLPLVDEEVSKPSTNDRPTERVENNAETILVVEDDEAIRQLVERSLRQAGYRVLAAAGPADARKWMEQEGDHVALLFTDVVMPETSGPELAAELRARRPSLRVLFTSGYADNRVFESAQPPPDAQFLPKPYNFTTLTAKVREALRG